MFYRVTSTAIWGFAACMSCAFGQGIMETLAGTEWVFPGNGAPALNAPIGPLVAVTVDRSGNPVFADPGSGVVLRIEASGSVTTLAGNGLQLYSGDGGPSLNAALNSPFDAAYDSNGNLYIADGLNNRVRMVTPAGTITTIAGTGAAGYSGENQPAVNAMLNQPYRIAVDSSGAVYVFDLNNYRIRRIAPTGVITTFAGNGRFGYTGDNGPATQASLYQVSGMAFDAAGNLYLTDFGNNTLRKIAPNGIITTVAGNGSAGYSGDNGPAQRATLSSPGGVAVDSSNNIYVSDTNNYVIRKINPQGVISTFAGNGTEGYSGDGSPATSAAFNAPFGLAVDSSGNLYAADRDNYRVRKIAANGIVSTVAGNGAFRYFPDGTPASNAFLYWPFGVSVDGLGDVYVADTYNNRIRKVAPTGLVSTVAGNGGAGFRGDNGPATSAELAFPEGVTPDAAGNLYVADTDNSCIRKIALTGIITTVAGICQLPGSGGDGQLATQALLYIPEHVVFDGAGNMYISDSGNNRIRRVGLDGRISIFAGNGQAAFSGDNGAATGAGINSPGGLAFDAMGRLLVADWGNSRIRAIGTNGVITTVAGGGTQTPGINAAIPATQARLGTPAAVVADKLGNFYISDAAGNRILKVSATGMMTIVAGNGIAGFSGDGGSSTQASVDYPYGLALDSSGDLLVADVLNYRIRAILAAPPLVQVSSTSLTFSAKSGGAVTDPQNVTISGSMPGLAYGLNISTTDGASWLRATASSGSLPASLQIAADPTGLAPGNYRGNLVVTLPSVAQAQTIAVGLTVNPSDAPALGLGAKAINFSFVQGGAASSQNLAVLNNGGGSLGFSASIKTNPGENWLTLSSPTGQATPVQPASITLQAAPGQIAAGTYKAMATVAGNNGDTTSIPVTMTVSALNQKIVLSQAGMKFTAVVQGGAPLSQSFSIVNSGQGGMNWKVQTSTLSGGSGWLTATPSSGVAAAGSVSSVVTVSVNLNPPGSAPLSPGEYFGQIQVLAPGADNSPQIISVILDVLTAGTDPGPQVQPSGLIFTGAPGSSPSSQNVLIANLGAKAVNYSTARVTADGQNWLLQAPASGTIAPNQPGQIVVQPDFTQLAAGIYHGTLTFSFSSGVTRSVDVLSIVGTPGSSASAYLPQATNCATQPLQIQFQTLTKNFTAVVGQPTNIQVKVVDGCGNPVNAGTGVSVPASFTNKDPDVKLSPQGNGVWTNSWTPINQKTSVTVTVTAFTVQSSQIVSGQNALTGTLSTSATPTVTASGVVHAASFSAGSVAPGTLISVFGTNLTDGTGGASGLPLPANLNGTQVFVGNLALPLLYASPTQINVQIPFDVPVDTQFQIAVQRGVAVSMPDQLVVAPAQPGIFTVNQQGTGQGIILRSDQTTLAQPGNPAAIGEVVLIYCTGLGAVMPAVAAGQPAPAPPAPLSTTVNPVSVTIGGQPATVMFSGLSPGSAGLYQINAVVPAGITTSDSVPVTISVAGQVSSTVTMAVDE